MRNPGGYGLMIGPAGDAVFFKDKKEKIGRTGVFETDTFTCFHCSRIVEVAPKQDPADIGGFCKCCMKLICKYCVGKPCIPWEKKMEYMEARERLWRSVEGS